MNENLRSDLQHCLELLGQNDLQANNLSNRIYEIENLFDNINSDLDFVQNFAGELMQNARKNNEPHETVAALKFALLRLTKKFEELSSITLNQDINNVLRRNHEVFFVIAKILEDR